MAILLPSPAPALELTLQALLEKLKRPAPDRTAFVEVRYVDLLDAPLKLSGELEYLGRRQLVKRIGEPYAETTTLNGEQVTLARAGERTRRFSLKRAPELVGFFASFDGLLGGDAKILEQHFTITLSGDEGRWQLKLRPRDPRLARRIVSVVISGGGAEPRCFRVDEKDGDASIMLVAGAASEALPEPLALETLAAHCLGPAAPSAAP